MRVLVTMQHPAHVHFFKHIIWSLQEAGHEVRVVAREKDVNVQLLEAYDIPYKLFAGPADSLTDLMRVQLTYEYHVLREALRFRPDVITAIHGLAAAHVAPLVGAKSVIFVDDLAANSLTVPFATVAVTPRNFTDDFGRKHVRYDGYHELAYLHPNRFTPTPEALREYGVDPDERYFVVRFSDMKAHHDVGESGLSPDAKRRIVSRLAELGPVYASIEGDGEAFDDCTLPVPVHLMHDLLYHAALFVTDSSTMPTEAAILGTPAVRCNSFARDNEVMCNFIELAERYDLVHSTPDEAEALELVERLATDPSSKAEWRRKRDRMLADKIDVTAFATALITSVGESGVDVPEFMRLGQRQLPAEAVGE